MPEALTSLLELAGDRRRVLGTGVSGIRNRRMDTSLVAGPYRGWADPPQLAVDLNRGSARDLAAVLGVPESVAGAIVRARRGRRFDGPADLSRIRGIGPARLQKAQFLAVGARPAHPAITALDVGESDRLLSGRANEVNVGFVPSHLAPVEVAELSVFWEGAPYVVQRALTRRDRAEGRFTFRMGRADALTVGPVRFEVRLFDSAGGTAAAGVGTYVLPSNPLSLNLTPGNAHYRSWIARATLNMPARSFTTVIDWTVSNTTGATRTFTVDNWRATDGGSHVETVNSNFSSTVANNSTRSIRTTLSSPANSPIGKLLNRGGDFTLRLRVQDDRGMSIEDTIVVQPWLGYNMNIVRVGWFNAGDRTGLGQAANHASSIFQQINVTMNRLENNWFVTGDTTAWETLDNDEFDDLLEYASVPNDGIDVFVVRDFTGGTGISPRPGDCSKGGDSDGLVIDRRYDSSGNLYWRGMGQTLAHETGHYFSLEQTNSGHTPSNAANDFRVMHPTFRENRTVFVWDEYYDAYDHCMLLLIH